MKIFHTADWHIGKNILNQSLISEQIEVLDKFTEKIEEEDPDLIIIAGDIYDKPIPSLEAIELLNRTLKKIVMKLQKKVIIISGNHDSSKRLSFGAEILRENGLYIVSDIHAVESPIKLEDDFGNINIYPIPFVSLNKAKRSLSEDINSYDDIAKYMIEKIEKKIDLDERNICVYHGFVTKIDEENIECDSERPLSIGGSDYVSSKYFDIFDYVALGHLHGPQKVARETMRYSGSLMKYSFSESVQKKGITVLKLEKKNSPIEIYMKEIYPKKDMIIIEGTFEEITNLRSEKRLKENYLMVIINCDGEIYGLKDELDKIFPYILRMEVRKMEKEKSLLDNTNIEDISKKSIEELFFSFYKTVTETEIEESRKEEVEKLLEKMGGK